MTTRPKKPTSMMMRVTVLLFWTILHWVLCISNSFLIQSSYLSRSNDAHKLHPLHRCDDDDDGVVCRTSTKTSTSRCYRSTQYYYRKFRTYDRICLSSSSSSSPLDGFDYEYIPPNPDARPDEDYYQSNPFSSSYPSGMPAGLRGEAVRSALQSGRCIGWNLSTSLASSSSTSLSTTGTGTTTTSNSGLLSTGGMIRVKGKGMLNFLNNKLTQDFSSYGSSGSINKEGEEKRGEDGLPLLLDFTEACLLDAKGRVIDKLQVAIVNIETAYIFTSPGHSSSKLLSRLDPFIFPMDEVTLTLIDNTSNDEESSPSSSSSFCTFTIASIQYSDVINVLSKQAFSNNFSDNDEHDERITFPKYSNKFTISTLTTDGTNNDSNTIQVMILPTTGLPTTTCVGYTVIIYNEKDEEKTEASSSSSLSARSVGEQIWNWLISDDNIDGPIHVGELEYESLRIEAGQPRYGKEMGDAGSNKGENDSDDDNDDKGIKVSPLELHWREKYINMDKGCYLGQEGVASIYKNPRGPPRLLYSIIFEDVMNLYDTQSRGDNSKVKNLTTSPKPGQKLYALGSNEEIFVGTLTSVAESGGTGDRCTVALGLIRRADTIIKQMKEFELEIERYEPYDTYDDIDLVGGDGPGSPFDDGSSTRTRGRGMVDIDGPSALIQPPPLDPLDGLEVIIEGSFTVGRLRMIPSRRLQEGKNMYDDDIKVKLLSPARKETTAATKTSSSTSTNTVTTTSSSTTDNVGITNDDVDGGNDDDDDDDDDEAEKLAAEAAKAAAEAEAAAAEAKRKAEKMEMLKKRAEEAMARRKKKKQS